MTNNIFLKVIQVFYKVAFDYNQIRLKSICVGPKNCKYIRVFKLIGSTVTNRKLRPDIELALHFISTKVYV